MVWQIDSTDRIAKFFMIPYIRLSMCSGLTKKSLSKTILFQIELHIINNEWMKAMAIGLYNHN